MGVIISKFRKKKTTLEVLEGLETQIKEIEEYQHNTELQRKRIVGHLILFSVGLYVIAAVLFYFFFFPATLYDQLFYITPLLIFPIIILFVKRLLSWYYNRRIRRNQSKLVTMKEEKKKILDKVMDTEVYKIAKDILEKYAPDQLKRTPSNVSAELVARRQQTSPQQGSVVRARPAANSQVSGSLPMPSLVPIGKPGMQTTPSTSRQVISAVQFGGATQSLPMPRSILPRERTVLDKMVEYLVGDGPSNRFALICKNCQSHNGMALREEFEYIAFRCCYCYHFNPARKLRPSAPKLETEQQKIFEIQNASEKSSSDSDVPSQSDSDNEVPTGPAAVTPVETERESDVKPETNGVVGSEEEPAVEKIDEKDDKKDEESTAEKAEVEKKND